MALFTSKHTVESRRVHEGNIINLRVDTLRLNDGQTVTREVVEHEGGVVIACRPAEDQIILIRQYRYSIDDYLMELPAGRIEKGEDPLKAAQRELTEETGIFGDLGFESVDTVALGAAVEEHFGQPLPFAEFLTKARDHQMKDVTIGYFLDGSKFDGL